MGNKKSKQKEGCFDATWICGACKKENDSFGKYSEKCQFCDEAYLADGYLNNNLTSTTYLPRNKQQKMIIHGFYRRDSDKSNDNNDITMDITKLIIKYWDILQLFVSSECSKDDKKYAGEITEYDYISEVFQIFKKNLRYCIHCKKGNIKLRGSCKQRILPFIFYSIKQDEKLIGYKNNINKFICDECEYYNIFNVKNNLLEFNESDKMGDIYDKKKGATYNIYRYWVSPFFEDMKFYKLKPHIIKSKDVKPKCCPMCDNLNIRIIGTDEKKRADYGAFSWETANYTRSIFYCGSCQLYIYKLNTVHTSTFQE
eukprot:44130_1